MIYLRLFWEFFKVGLFSVGGGLATLPFLYSLGAKTGWFSTADVANMLAVSESTPGPIGVNMATYAGFDCAGVLGGVVATLGLVTPSMIVIVLIAMALQMFGVFELIPETTIKAKPTKGYRATFMAGLLAGAFSSHCTTPVLIAMLAIVANRASMLYGVLLLIIFSVGHGVLSVVAGTSAGFVNRLMDSPRYIKVEKIVRIVLGIIILLAAAYLLSEVISEAFLHTEHVH